MDFDKDFSRLEEIIVLLEENSVDLNASLDLYKEGVELTKKLSDALTQAQTKLDEISAKS